MSRSKVFIASSSEGSKLAENLHGMLQGGGNVQLKNWKNAFTPGSHPLYELLEIAESVDFAILIATPDDMVETRGERHQTARDNVIFELGLFLGALGRERAILLTHKKVKLPSDLQGITVLYYDEDSGAALSDVLTGPKVQIEEMLERHGAMKRTAPAAKTALQAPVRTTSEALARDSLSSTDLATKVREDVGPSLMRFGPPGESLEFNLDDLLTSLRKSTSSSSKALPEANYSIKDFRLDLADIGNHLEDLGWTIKRSSNFWVCTEHRNKSGVRLVSVAPRDPEERINVMRDNISRLINAGAHLPMRFLEF